MRARTFLLGALALLTAVGATPAAAPRDAGPNLDVILADRPAATLGAYGLFRDPVAREPNAGVVAYDLPIPLFSDYAAKRRYVFMPAGTRAQYRDEGAFEFPLGTVLIKTFEYPADMRRPDDNVRQIETRLLIRNRTGWVANTYIWNAEGTDARLQVAGASMSVRWTAHDGGAHEITYAAPNRNQCKGCHSVDGAFTPIGPSAGHFGIVTAGETELARWARLGLLDGAPTSAPVAPVSLDARARAYLDINCAHCHNPRGPANTSGLDLRATQSEPARWGLRKRPIAAGRASADMSFAIDPGHPERSILLHRMASDDPGVMMPELGRTVVHAEGVELVRAWIAQMDAEGRPRQN
ncbi:MAG: hypothetical protein IV086_05745 [Hyphomonadaceae bacterium]|nr:MAG: hypothetical protein FD160_168 [Caulobacteraceae bacterium]MBT9445182.1 hypothetical protein [Hyphomonadaceae bacterium]TPW07720.1 MAG: hypothetical protein FD124_945 [Alphaproteobacteria bacterium]